MKLVDEELIGAEFRGGSRSDPRDLPSAIGGVVVSWCGGCSVS